MNQFVGLVIATALLTVPLSANALTFKSGEKKSFKTETGDVSRSYSNTPFEFDWGVKLPTQVVYYDEMRIDFKREVVDVRILESQSTEKTNDISTDAAVSSGSDSAMPTQSSQ